ncbi:MAG TPA: hypothetical protein VF671_23370 [Pseudomonas sp.]|jgi:hypothetical protein|uniref:hypothetical protein n=1 Tax=Pseudomonas sp. TaxID=306 RepID=UPI002EDACEF4
MPADQSVKSNREKNSVWIEVSKFKFLASDYFSLRNKYLAEPYKDKASKYIEGIWAGARLDAEDLAHHYPDVFSAQPGEPSVFYLDVSCSIGNKSSTFNKLNKDRKIESMDAELGLINYTYRNGITSIPIIDAIRNPDGTPVLIECSSIDRTCHAAFTLAPNMLVKYSYPVSQRSNWLKIQKFVVNALNSARE